MTKANLEDLLTYIDALIDVKIEQAFGRDSILETVRAQELLGELRQSIDWEAN